MRILNTLQLNKGRSLCRAGAILLLSEAELNYIFRASSEGFTPLCFGAGAERATSPIPAGNFTAIPGLQRATKAFADVVVHSQYNAPAAIMHDGYS
jgi:hypothetical protein